MFFADSTTSDPQAHYKHAPVPKSRRLRLQLVQVRLEALQRSRHHLEAPPAAGARQALSVPTRREGGRVRFGGAIDEGETDVGLAFGAARGSDPLRLCSSPLLLCSSPRALRPQDVSCYFFLI